jgi:hypothetical protein
VGTVPGRSEPRNAPIRGKIGGTARAGTGARVGRYGKSGRFVRRRVTGTTSLAGGIVLFSLK